MSSNTMKKCLIIVLGLELANLIVWYVYTIAMVNPGEQLAIKYAGIFYPASLAKGDTWYFVGNNKQAFVFSAYHDAMAPTNITVIGAHINGENQSYFCQLWYSPKLMIEVPADIKAYGGLHERKYRQCGFICKLPNDEIPSLVSLVKERAKAPTNLIPIKEIKKVPYERNFTVCLKPLSRHYDRAYELVEWIELCRILGAEKFVIYNYSSEVNVAAVLDEYTNQGIVEVVQWPIPIVDKIHEYGTVSSLNDCLYRSKQTSKYLVVLDTDEFIVPHCNNCMGWNDLLDDMPTYNVYLFRNVFFRKEWNDTEKKYSRKRIAKTLRLTTLLKTEREEKTYETKRTKYIINTSTDASLGNHCIGEKNDTTKGIVTVQTKIGYLHHYRNWNRPNGDEPRFRDEIIISKYKDLLIDKVVSVWSKLKIREIEQ